MSGTGAPAANPGIPPALAAGLSGFGPAAKADDADFAAWAGRCGSALVLEFFLAGQDTPALALALAADQAGGADEAVRRFHSSVAMPLAAALRGAGGGLSGSAFYLPRLMPAAELPELDWLCSGWGRFYAGTPAKGPRLFVAPRAAKALAALPAGSAADSTPVAPGIRMAITDPGEFHLARCFLPLTLRRGDMTVRSRVRQLRWRPAGEAWTAAEGEALHALRWTLGGEHAVFWLACPAAIPPAMVRTLADAGAADFRALSGAALELAGPAAAAGLDPRQDHLELLFEVTARARTARWTVFLPRAFVGRLHKLFADPAETALAPTGGVSTLTAALGISRRLLSRGVAARFAPPAAPASDEDIACALFDRADDFGERDFLLVVQNWFIPRGLPALIDAFFPRGCFDPLIWQRVTRSLGEKLTLTLAESLKTGDRSKAGLDDQALRELVQAVAANRLDLSPRGRRVVSASLGNLLSGRAAAGLQPLLEAGLPGVLLARLRPDERMKALDQMTDRDRSIAFLGQRDHVLTLMEAFSKNGKQRALEDFDLLAKGWESGAIEAAQVIFAKDEACMMIARHVVQTRAGSWSDSDWRTLRAGLSAEDLAALFGPGSCLEDLPARARLLKAAAPETPDSLESALEDKKKDAGWRPKPLACVHRDLAALVLKADEDEEVIPAAHPKPRR